MDGSRRYWFLSALVLLTLAGHLPFLASTLEDLDSFNFALGLHEFDPRKHQPHPPGYPVIIGLGRAARLLAGALGQAGAEADARALAGVSAVSGAVLVVPLFVLFAHLERIRRQAGSPDTIAPAATVIAVFTPLAWFAMSRPMSDIPGLALAVGSQALLVGAWTAFRARDFSRGDRRLTWGTVVAALAVGARSQGVWLVVPILLLAFVSRHGPGASRAQGRAILAGAGAVAAWAVPLVLASGGIGGYLSTLADQAVEDFAGVEMLWTTRSARVAAFALRYTFLDIWGPLPVGAIALAAALAGGVALALRPVPALLVAGVLWLPYLVFHLLFQETVTSRYGLPIVPLLAWLAAIGLSRLPRPAAVVAVAAFVVTGVTQTTSALARYAADGSPIARVIDSLAAEPVRMRLATHHVFSRAFEADSRAGRPLTARRGREWLDVVAGWQREGGGPRWLLAESHRTDIALVDPESRRMRGRFEWTFDADRYIGGTRPGPVVWHELAERPRWLLGDGWAVTPELAGIADRDGTGLGRGPIEALVLRRPEAAVVVVGGRHLGSADDPPVRVEVGIDGTPIDGWTAGPGPFLRVIQLAAGRLAGDGYARLAVSATPQGNGRLPPVAVEQFDLQSEGTAVWAFGDGWYEAEYDRRTRKSFRWTGRRADLRILGAAGDVEIALEADSPLKYVAEPPIITIAAGDLVVKRERVEEAFTWRVKVPHAALVQSVGVVTITTDRMFRPSDSGLADRRELGLRFFTVTGSR